VLLAARLVGPHHLQAPELVVERVEAGRGAALLALAGRRDREVLLLDRSDPRCSARERRRTRCPAIQRSKGFADHDLDDGMSTHPA
jgi:hypothetical protein